MPLLQLDTENADLDLSSLITVLTDTPHASKATLCQGLVVFGDGAKDLDGTGGDFSLTITVGGQTIQPDPQTVTFSTAVRSSVWTTIFPVPANTEVILRVLSPNAADSDVDVTAYLYEVTGALPDAAPDAAGGLPISDAGGLDMDVALQKGMLADGKIHINPNGTNSTAWPYGTAPYPTTTIPNGKTIGDANDIGVLVIHGNHTLAAAMEEYTFVGHGHIEFAHLISCGGFSTEHSVFERLVVSGASGNAAGALNMTRYIQCLLWAHTNINGYLTNGGMVGACSILDGGNFIGINVTAGGMTALTLTLNAPAQCDIFGLRGAVTLAGMDGGVCVIARNGAAITIDNTCTAGTITISGSGPAVTDNSGVGCTVIITVPRVNQVQLGGSAQSTTDLKDFADTGYDPTTHKVQGVVLTDTLTTYTNNTPQSGDSYAVVNHADHGNAKLVRSTTPANALDVSATGEAGLDFNNIKNATGAHTLTNITVPTVTTISGSVTLTVVERNAVADATLNRGASNVEETADRHSLGALIMIISNAAVSGASLVAKKPSDDSVFQTYTVTKDATADPITGVS